MHSFESKLARDWPSDRWRDMTVLVAVSGGADSVALLRALVALRGSGPPRPEGTLIAAHFNHRLRGDDATADERFVLELCRRLAIPSEVGRADAAEAFPSDRDGLEAAARKARYRFLEQAAGRCGARWVAVAHTADDQAETILHRIVRGTGLVGLSGMARSRPLGPAALTRPMLGVRRSEVLEYLSDIGQPFQTDPTNANLRFTRNRLRHELLPHLAQAYNPNVVDALLRLGRLAGEVRQWMDRQIEPLQAACRSETDGKDRCIRLDTRPLHAEPAAVVRELFVGLWRERGWPMQQMGFEQWNLLADMARASGEPSRPPRKHTFPGGIQAEAGPDELVLRLPRHLAP